LSATSTWASGQQYDPAAVNTFLQVADYYLVAQAHALGSTVVTHEIAANSIKKIKIPDACLTRREVRDAVLDASIRASAVRATGHLPSG